MGRRSEKIKTRKTKQAAAKTKLFARIGKVRVESNALR